MTRKGYVIGEYEVTVDGNGRLTIPSQIRRRLQIKKGTRVKVFDMLAQIALLPITLRSEGERLDFFLMHRKLKKATPVIRIGSRGIPSVTRGTLRTTKRRGTHG